MASISGIYAADAAAPRLVHGAAVRLQDGVAAAPAEADGADLMGAGGQADGVDEAVDDGFGDGFAVGEQPGAEGGGDDGGVFGLFGKGEAFLGAEGGFDVLEEGERERVAGLDVGDVGVEAGFCVLVGEEADVFEFVAEDYCGSPGGGELVSGGF